MSRRARQRADARPWERNADLDDGLMSTLDLISQEQNHHCGQDAREEHEEQRRQQEPVH